MAMFNIFLARHRSEKRNANINLLCILFVPFRFLKHLRCKKSYIKTLLIPSPITNKGEENGGKNKGPNINSMSQRFWYRPWKLGVYEVFFMIQFQNVSVKLCSWVVYDFALICVLFSGTTNLTAQFRLVSQCISVTRINTKNSDTVEPLITDTAGEFKFCPL